MAAQEAIGRLAEAAAIGEPLPFIPRRLEKFLRDATTLSVDAGRLANERGHVEVLQPGSSRPQRLRFDDLIFPDDIVLLDQQRVVPRQRQTTLMLNKPQKVTATLRDPLGQRDLTSFIEAMPEGVFPVGRLDRDTTGLLLFTSDGDLANAILHPEHETDKVYWLWLDEHVVDDDPRLRQLVAGVPVRDYVARAVSVIVQHRTECCTELLVTLRQGKNRQIRKMCRALDFYLRHLHRKSIGTLCVDALPVGQWRQLSEPEVEALWQSTGGRQRARERKVLALQRRARERRTRGAPEHRLEAWLELWGASGSTKRPFSCMSRPMTDASPKKSMDEIMALCKRRGFIFQASEIYGGINGFWDYGPLGAQLKKNVKDAWWQDTVLTPPIGPDGKPVSMVGLDSCIIQNPRVWEASGHIGGFNDPMVDCRESKRRYRADHLWVASLAQGPKERFYAFLEGDDEGRDRALKLLGKYAKKKLGDADVALEPLSKHPASILAQTVGPDTKEAGTLTEPRAFNLMFKTYVGATASEDDAAYLRPETAQGIFLNFKNVMDTTRVKMPFGIAQIGKAFRNEVTPRNFTFRSREFEQMEIEFFCAPNATAEWYKFWRDLRMSWWQSLGLASDNLVLREHDKDELAHYAKHGAGTSDVEYRFPFTYPGFGELEGVADRSDFDLKQHAQFSKTKLEYFDPETKERYVPHVIEPSGGVDRGVLALLCEAYTSDPSRPSKVYMKFAPRVSPLKAGVFPLVAKDGMPEIAEKLYRELKPRFGTVEFDAKQTIGKRYARMDEAGCPFCFTIDSDTAKDQSVTVRERDTCAQERVALDKVSDYLAERIFV